MFLVLFFVFVIGWLLAWAAFHVAGGGIHILLVLAVVWLLAHFMRRRTV
ncbi:MAG: lmo0937 family membrane protein [Acidobacteriia bacterium]|nr:lmo0937 family membrane protein [Terriglobia bacterium]